MAFYRLAYQKKWTLAVFSTTTYDEYVMEIPMKQSFFFLSILFFSCSVKTINVSPKRPPFKPQHSNILVKKITNNSGKPAFIALERLYSKSLNDNLNIAAPLMNNDFFEVKDPDGEIHGVAIPVWQKTFRGNKLNIITLSGNPGRIYFLYAIEGHLWAIKTPEKKDDLKGFHLLDPSEQPQEIEIKILKNNGLQAIPFIAKKTEIKAESRLGNQQRSLHQSPTQKPREKALKRKEPIRSLQYSKASRRYNSPLAIREEFRRKGKF